MQVVADLHLHSKYSQAVSKCMTLETMQQEAVKKGLDLLATGDWTHPLWLRELQTKLVETEEGIFSLKTNQNQPQMNQKSTRFLLSVEIANIFSQNGKGRRIHNLVFAPSFTVVEKINAALIQQGANLSADGRPVIGLSSKDLLQLILEIDERTLLIPAHVWTPWFGMYGMKSGFDSIHESFGELSRYIYGIETGLSSDPEMNWQMEELNARSILSFSDAHSLAKMGREATVFELEALSYENIRRAIMEPSKNRHPELSKRTSHSVAERSEGSSSLTREDSLALPQNDKNKVLYTIEFYPEEGKYHYSGHRNCHIFLTPEEQTKLRGICPVCHRHVTDGVLRRVQELSHRPAQAVIEEKKQVKWFFDPRHIHPPFVKLVPLLEIIAETVGTKVGSKKVQVLYDKLTTQVDSELAVLLTTPLKKIEQEGGAKLAQAVQRVREGNITIIPGYDGVYGTVHIWDENTSQNPYQNQLTLRI